MRIFLTVLFLAALPSAAQSLSGRRAPSFSLPDATTAQHDILDYRGNWLLLDFMQTDCPPCKELSKKLETVKTRYGGKVAVLSVVVTPPENGKTIAKYAGETKSTSTFLFDQGQVTVTYFKATPQNPKFDVPHLFAVSPAGMIVKDWPEQALSAPGFVTALTQLLGPATVKQ
jgi:thiol-disulfide isomerase/thioredoxin